MQITFDTQLKTIPQLLNYIIIIIIIGIRKERMWVTTHFLEIIKQPQF